MLPQGTRGILSYDSRKSKPKILIAVHPIVEVCNVRSAIPTDNQQKFAKAHEKSHEKL